MVLQQQLLYLLRTHQARLLQPISPCSGDHVSCVISRFFCESQTAPAFLCLENSSLLKNLHVLGVDLNMVRQRQPGVLRKVETNERGLATFLSSKGASQEVTASIISRFPRAITRSGDHLEERWKLWRKVFQHDEEILNILYRSPESFFRSSNNENLGKNILYLTSLGIAHLDLPKLLMKAPRVFSNSLELNRDMVELLQHTCVGLGGTDPEAFARAILVRNMYILIRSTKRISANIQFLVTSLKLSNNEALSLLQSHGAKILDLSHTILKRNFTDLQAKLKLLGCCSSGMKRLLLNYSQVLFISPNRLNEKLDCLMESGIKVEQIVEKPKVLDFSTATLKQRLDKLNTLEYDFAANGINILDMSKLRFEAKLKKIQMVRQ